MQLVNSNRLIDSGLALYTGGTVTADGALGTGLDLHGAGTALGTGTTDLPGDAPLLADVLLDITALDVASTDETYTFRLFGANIVDFSAKYLLATYEVGRAAVTGTAKRLGRHVIPFRNYALEDAGTYPSGGGVYRSFRYIRLELDVGGTSPSVTCSAQIAPIQRIG